MRPRAHIPMLTAALTSPAYATEFASNGGGGGQATIAARHHSKDPAVRTISGGAGFTYAAAANRYPPLTTPARHMPAT